MIYQYTLTVYVRDFYYERVEGEKGEEEDFCINKRTHPPK